MLKLIKCELLKIRSLKSLIIAFIVPLFMAIIGFLNIYNGVIETTDLWDAVYNQTLLLYAALTLPLSITIITALQWRLEYKHNNILNLCSSSIKLYEIFLSKVITTLIIVFFNILILVISLLIFAQILIPEEPFRAYILYGPLIVFLYSIPFICLQHLFAMYIKNFIGSISIGILLSFSGFILSQTPLGILIPSTYISCGSFIGITNYPIAADLSYSTYYYSYTNALILVVPILSMLIYICGNYLFNKKDFI